MNTLLSIGLSFEILGAWMMSYGYFSSVPFWQVPTYLLLAIFNPRSASFTAKLSTDLNGPKRGHVVQGLSFLIIGFTIQIVANTPYYSPTSMTQVTDAHSMKREPVQSVSDCSEQTETQ